MKKIFRKFIVCLISIVLILSSTGIIAMAEKSQNVVKVGYFLFDGYHMVDDYNGHKSGYGYEYLQNMRVYTGHNYEYIGDDEPLHWEHMLDLLDTGGIDLLTSVSKDEERMEKFAFSDQPIGQKSAILVVNAGSNEYQPNDYENWDGMQVGMLKENSKNESFSNYAKENGFSYEAVYMDSNQKLTESLKNGSTDAIISSDLSHITEDEWIIAKFDPTPFYVCVKKGNDALLEEVNNAILEISKHSPYLEELLQEKYYAVDNSNHIFFTLEEREFIKECQENATVFKALINSDQEPYSHYQDGEFVGSNVEICKSIIALTGLNIEFIQSTTVQDYIDCITSGEADIILDSVLGHNACEIYGYIQSTPYYSASVSSLTKRSRDNSDFDVVALVNMLDYRESKDIRSSYSYQEIIGCESTAETIRMVDDGEVDATYLFSVVADRAVRADPKNSMISTGISLKTVDFSIAVQQDQNILLSSILSKASAAISEQDIAAISQPFLGVQLRPITLTAFIYENPFTVALLTGAFVAFIAMAVIVFLVNRSKRRKEHLNLKLTHALGMADKANTDKSRFLAQMSHEIRTPMNAIIGLTSIAKVEINEPEKVKSNLNKISDSSRVLLHIINDILDMSSIEGGKMKIDHVAFDFKKLVFDITTMFYQQTKGKNIEFNVHMGCVMNETLVGDELRTQQILMNLLSNAGKFTPSGGKIDLIIQETSKSQDRIHVRYIVADTGCGMSLDMQSRLFSPFEQQDASTAKKYGGSGLGLSITKNLVGLMGGVIQVKSVEGEGTQFMVDIPYATGKETFKSTNECFAEIRTLVIDSGIESNDYVDALLNRLAVPHNFVNNLDEAMEMLGAAEEDGCPYKMCLLDWNTPDMSGIEFIQTVREVFGNDDIVIMVIAYDLDEIKLDSNVELVNYFIPKPLFQSTLLNALMNIVGNSSLAISSKIPTDHYDFTGKTILIVEDVTLNMEVAVKLLELVNAKVESAEDGKIAVDLYKNAPIGTYDCILMDINMPVMNGYEATRVIRSMDREDATVIPIYAMTANAFSEDIQAALDSGMNGHIAKPIETEILYRLLKKALYGGSNE